MKLEEITSVISSLIKDKFRGKDVICTICSTKVVLEEIIYFHDFNVCPISPLKEIRLEIRIFSEGVKCGFCKEIFLEKLHKDRGTIIVD